MSEWLAARRRTPRNPLALTRHRISQDNGVGGRYVLLIAPWVDRNSKGFYIAG